MIRFTTYRMIDDPGVKQKSCIHTPLVDCKKWNEKNYGIFWTFNEFKNNKRTIENLTKLNCWCVDLDSGTKLEQIEKIKAGLIPSLVVETKRGYHVYFMAKDADLGMFKHIMVDRLIPFYDADRNAKDVSRVLRVPGYYHCKDPSDKFLIQKVWEQNCSYSQEMILDFYPDENKDRREVFEASIDAVKTHQATTTDLWREVYDMDCMNALTRLSGHPAVNGERFEFKRNSNGNYNIFVNGQSTSCFIDKFGRIGSSMGGGPTTFQWINYYLKNNLATVEVMKEIFKELPWKH